MRFEKRDLILKLNYRAVSLLWIVGGGGGGGAYGRIVAMDGGCGTSEARKPRHYREYKGPESILQWTLKACPHWTRIQSAFNADPLNAHSIYIDRVHTAK